MKHRSKAFLVAAALSSQAWATPPVVEVNSSGTTQYFDEAIPDAGAGAVFSSWSDQRAKEINPYLDRTLQFKIYGQTPTDVFEVHAVQNYASTGGQYVALNFQPVEHILRISCGTITLASQSVKANADGEHGQLNASVTFLAKSCPDNEYRADAIIRGSNGTIFTSPFALSINKLETSSPQIPPWENPGLDACQKKALMEAAGIKVPRNIEWACMLLKVS